MKSLFAALPLSLLAGAAFAQGNPPLPGAPAETAPICTDRPTKSNFACTVPEGMVQIESDLFNWARLSDGGARTDTYLVTNPTFKYGLTGSTDLEANIAPYAIVESHAGGAKTRVSGVGDLYLRVKQRLTAADGKAQFALVPYVKAPTAKRGVGNGEWEGGVIAPFNYSLPHGVTLTVVPELDLLADSDDLHDRHAQLAGLINIGFALTPKLTLYTELWTAQNYDPAATIRQYSADWALACVVTPNLQFDVGGNFGLNRFTPDAQLYVGVSTRF